MGIKEFLINTIKVVGVVVSFALVFRKQLMAEEEVEPKPAEDLNAEEQQEEQEKQKENPDKKPQEIPQEKPEDKQTLPQKWLPTRFARYFANTSH